MDMFCAYCGKELKNEAKFCSRCGKEVRPIKRREESADNPVTAEHTQPVPSLPINDDNPFSPSPVILCEVEYTPDIRIDPEDVQEAFREDNSSGRLKGKPLLIGLAVFLIILIGGTGYLFLSGTREGFPTSTANLETTFKEGGSSDSGTERIPIYLEVPQVDNTNFPQLYLYVKVTDSKGKTVTGLTKEDFQITEIDQSGLGESFSIEDVYQVMDQDKININLVLDVSGSMALANKMQQVKNATEAFVEQIALDTGDQVAVISFDDYVYLNQDFTSQKESIIQAIGRTSGGGDTALYDAIYSGLFQTYGQTGAKCVIAFTDGDENSSSYTYEDVVSMAKSTGIPVFIIGIGEEYNTDALQTLAKECSGKYYSAKVEDLESILEEIYVSIYQEQQNYYVIEYTSANTENMTAFREILVEGSAEGSITGSFKRSYLPKADIAGAFSEEDIHRDYILDFSSRREVTERDLTGLSLAQLRIARNEIFARHGRQFKDPMLNQWFYSKVWYLNLPFKCSPDEFEGIRPSPLTKLESANAAFILNYEQNLMNTQDIFPNAFTFRLSEYDLALSKAVLNTALVQMLQYPNTAILSENVQKVQLAITKEEVQY